MKPHPLLKYTFVAALVGVMAWSQSASASPMLSLTTAGGTGTAASIVAGTPTFTVGLHFDSDGNRVADLTYYLTTTPANAVNYASTTPVAVSATTAGNPNPFSQADLDAGQAPAGGSTVAGGGAGMTVFFNAGTGDFAPFTAEIAQYTFDTSTLAANSTYVFTPVGFELVNAANAVSPIESDGFASPGSFSLTVTPTPEPASLATAGLLILVAGHRRRRTVLRT